MALSDYDRRLVAMFLSSQVSSFQSFLAENEIDGSEADFIIDELNNPDGLVPGPSHQGHGYRGGGVRSVDHLYRYRRNIHRGSGRRPYGPTSSAGAE